MSLHPEQQYLDLVRRVIEEGEKRQDRTGTGTYAIFAPPQLRFPLKLEAFPLLTTKRVNFPAVAKELLWFLRGDTNSQTLSEQGVKIWEQNGSREFLDSRGLTERAEGDLGPIYGFQWRFFGAPYETCEKDYRALGAGVDQIKRIVEQLKNEPHSRRILLSAWNPLDLDKMALPPCHVMAQFYVSNESELSCLLFQRSGDLGLGVPFNIASYALLTCMLAQVCGYTPGELIHTLGDAHVYVDHIAGLKEQLKRAPRPFPKLVFQPKEGQRSMDDWTMDDFCLLEYNPWPRIILNMSV